MSGMRRGRAFWMDTVAEFEREPCLHAEFVARHGLTLSGFRSWLYRLRDEGTSMDGAPDETCGGDESEAGAPARFVEVVPEMAGGPSAACTVETASLRIHFRTPPSASYLAELLRAAG